MRRTSRWLVPVAVATTIVGGTAVSSAMAGSTPALPQRTAEQVLAAVAGSRVTTMSGTVATHADLGLPALPSGMGGPGRTSTSSPQALITRFLAGDNTVRVWVDGPRRERAQLIDPFADLDVVRNGTDLWTYDSRTNTAQHAVLPASLPSHPGSAGSGSTGSGSAGSGTGTAGPGVGRGGVPRDLRDLTPDQLARQVLDAVDPTTSVTLDPPTNVAGQDAYTLRVTPKSAGTLVDHVLIAVDAANGVPLRVTVYARGHADPALQSGFTSVDFARPASSVFSFTPPRSATVKQLTLPAHPGGHGDTGDHGGSVRPGDSGRPRGGVRPGGTGPASGTGSGPASGPGSGSGSGSAGTARPAVIGTGWTTVVELASGPAASSWTTDPKSANLVRGLTTPVPGGRALRTALVSLLLTDDGRVLVGAVPLQTLQDAAARR